MLIRLVCHSLPPSNCYGHQDIRLGLQQGKEVVQEVSMDRPEAVFEADVRIVDNDFRGPFVHGPRGERFLYLNWSDNGMGFRRAKIQLLTIPQELMTSDVVEGRVGMTDEKGGPRCASVRPPVVVWS